MYQTDFVCTYKWMESAEDQESLYRIQLLQAFDLEQWNDDVFNATVTQLYHMFEKSDEYAQILAKTKANEYIHNLVAQFNMTPAAETPEHSDDELYFSILFNFHTFDLFHRCIIDYTRDTKVNPVNLNKLFEAL
jgi:hypothetical protein